MDAPVINPNTSVLGFRQWQTWDYQPYATNMPTSWACPGLPPGMSIDAASGLISGYATAAGVWVCPLSATNDTGTSDAFILTIGIEAAVFDPNECPTFLIDLDTGHISSPDGSRSSTKTDAPLFWVKQGDTLPLLLRFYNGDTFVEMTLSSLIMAVKQFEPEETIVLGGGATVDTDFKKYGADDSTYFVMVTNFASAALAGALTDYEADTGTYFFALAEIEFRFPNPFGVGADPLIRTTRTFVIGIERDLEANS